jgi:hypothetical protein
MRVNDAVVTRKRGRVHPLRLVGADQGEEAPPPGGRRSIAGDGALQRQRSDHHGGGGTREQREGNNVYKMLGITLRLEVNSERPEEKPR